MSTLTELRKLCKEKGLTNYSKKTKEELKALLAGEEQEEIHRLNYIGSKFQLIDWLFETMKLHVPSFENKKIADLFSGTGIVSYFLRKEKAITISNDAELYSYYITRSFSECCYTDSCKDIIETINKELKEGKKETGFITKNYSPYEDCERMFFTIDNAQKIDYIRKRIEEFTTDFNDKTFLIASLLYSADSISNVPAVYGCYLKNFKDKAKKVIELIPIHNYKTPPQEGCKTYNEDVLKLSVDADIVYLDPPYNQRQYSKNYFPLNIIAKHPDEQEQEELKGVTGIPEGCFTSSFCRKGKPVEESFDKLFSSLKTKWLFLSYNSESIVSKEKMTEIMSKYGSVTVYEQDYKRFKSFKYNKDTDIQEYLFCLKFN